MTLRQLFNLLSLKWRVHLVSESDGVEIYDFSDSRRFGPYLDREIDSAEKISYAMVYPYVHIVLKERYNERTIKELLKELEKQNFEVSWRYEATTNAVIVRIRKKYNSQWYGCERALSIEHFHAVEWDTFEPYMCQILKEMAQKTDQAAREGVK